MNTYTITDQLLREESSRKRLTLSEHTVLADFIRPKAYALAEAIQAQIDASEYRKSYHLLLADLDLVMVSARLLVDVTSTLLRGQLTVPEFTLAMLDVLRETIEDEGVGHSGSLTKSQTARLESYREHVMSRSERLSRDDTRTAALILLAAGHVHVVREDSNEQVTEQATERVDGPLAGDLVLTNVRDEATQKTRKLLSLSEATEALLSTTPIRTVQRHQPMLICPRPWTSKHKGGYLNNTTRLVHDYKGRRFEPSQECLDAANAAQSTAWRINSAALEFANKYAEDFDVDKVKLEAAQQLSQLDSFYHVGYLDFRGRVYAEDDIGACYSDSKTLRGCYEFAEGKPLGDAYVVLYSYVAGLLGQDNLDLDVNRPRFSRHL